jgi:hypothetical protein
MLPCERIAVSLVDVCDRPGQLRPGAPEDGHRYHHSVQQERSQPLPAHGQHMNERHAVENTARVFYLNHPADHSFVDVHFFVQLWSKKHGDSVPLPALSEHTRVRLRWRFPSVHGMFFTTTHSVLREITFDIILRENDWYEPILRLMQWEKSRSLHMHNSAHGEQGVARDGYATGRNLSSDEEDQMLREASVASDSGNEDFPSSCVYSPRSSSVAPSSPSACPSDDGHTSYERDHTFGESNPAVTPGTERGEHEVRSHGSAHPELTTTAVPTITKAGPRDGTAAKYWQWSHDEDQSAPTVSPAAPHQVDH